MAQPQQYIGLGGEAPAIVDGIPGEGTDEYRETYRPATLWGCRHG